MTYRPQFNHGDLEIRAAQYEADRSWEEFVTNDREHGEISSRMMENYACAAGKAFDELQDSRSMYVPNMPGGYGEYYWAWEGANVWSNNQNDVLAYASWNNAGFWTCAIVENGELLEIKIEGGAGLWGDLPYRPLRKFSEIAWEHYEANCEMDYEGPYLSDDFADENERDYYEYENDSDLMNEW